MKQIKNVWKVEYQNDVDVADNGDESFREWLEVTGKDMTFKCDSQKEAQWLCDVLNERENN